MGASFSATPRFAAAGLLTALPIALAAAQSIGSELKVNGLVRPIFLTHAPNDFSRVFIIEKQGRIRIAEITPSGAYTLRPTAFLDIDPLVVGGTSEFSEQGLLGLAFHPDYANNRLFYVNYTAVAGSGDTVIAEYSVSADPNIATPAAVRTIMTFDQPQSNHNGGWIAFGPDNYLYIGTGDGGNANDQGAGHTEPGGNGQDVTSNRLGKILRVDVNGDDFPADNNRNYAIPPTNPFVGTGNDGEIWAYGLRNPWRNSFDRLTGDLWIADVGQNNWEEVNFQRASSTGGENYGWRCYEGNAATGYPNTTCDGTYVFPIQVYSHSSGCSITGGYVYRGCAIPALQGTYFYTDYCTDTIWSFRYNGSSVTEFTNRTSQLDPPGALTAVSLSSFGEDAYGEVYLLDQVGGEVFKIVPTGAVTPDCNSNGRNDDCELLDGSQTDSNGNGILDSCECVGDFDDNGVTDLADLSALLSAFGTCTGQAGYDARFDLDASGCIDLSDLSQVLSDFGCTL
jgi:glucose/arabinose dehydrogenase